MQRAITERDRDRPILAKEDLSMLAIAGHADHRGGPVLQRADAEERAQVAGRRVPAHHRRGDAFRRAQRLGRLQFEEGHRRGQRRPHADQLDVGRQHPPPLRQRRRQRTRPAGRHRQCLQIQRSLSRRSSMSHWGWPDQTAAPDWLISRPIANQGTQFFLFLRGNPVVVVFTC